MKDGIDRSAGLPQYDLTPQDIEVLRHEQEGTTAYRFVAPGVVLGGVVRVSVQGDWWHAEQRVDGETIAVDGEDEMGVILALIAKQSGLAAVFAADTGETPDSTAPGPDDVIFGAFNSVTRAVARAGCFLPLSARQAVAEQVVADMRTAGVIG